MIYADRARHLWTPGGRRALLALADDFGIRRHWYHATPGHEHVDIPARDIARVLADPRVTVVSAREIVRLQAEVLPENGTEA